MSYHLLQEDSIFASLRITSPSIGFAWDHLIDQRETNMHETESENILIFNLLRGGERRNQSKFSTHNMNGKWTWWLCVVVGRLWSCLVLRYSNYVFSAYYLLCFHENQQGLFTIKATHVLKVVTYGNRHYRVSCSCYTSFHSLFPVTVTNLTRKGEK